MLKIEEMKRDHETVYTLTGSLDTVNSPRLAERLSTLPEDTQSLVLDLAHLRYVSSSGLRVILFAFDKMKQNGGSLRLTHVNEITMEVLHDTGLSDFLTIERDEGEEKA